MLYGMWLMKSGFMWDLLGNWCLILNREQKSKLFNAISILGRRRTQILEGLNFTLNQLKLNNEDETV